MNHGNLGNSALDGFLMEGSEHYKEICILVEATLRQNKIPRTPDTFSKVVSDCIEQLSSKCRTEADIKKYIRPDVRKIVKQNYR